MQNTTTTRSRRGARPFTNDDLQAGETLRWGRIQRGRYTLVNSKAGVQVTGPGLHLGTLTSANLETARTRVDGMAGEDRDRRAAADEAWAASCARTAELNRR